jgi:hypothetical protein
MGLLESINHATKNWSRDGIHSFALNFLLSPKIEADRMSYFEVNSYIYLPFHLGTLGLHIPFPSTNHKPRGTSQIPAVC